jgi:hypothetical protein
MSVSCGCPRYLQDISGIFHCAYIIHMEQYPYAGLSGISPDGHLSTDKH